MKPVQYINEFIAKILISKFDDTDNQRTRIKYGMAAAWASICINILLFAIKIIMGLMSGSISVLADAFHLLSHLANSIILGVTFWVTGKPATSRNPFGHGRMEHVGPLIMSIFLIVSGIQIAEKSFHQAIHPGDVHFWPALPWILLATVFAKYWLKQFILFLGKRVNSKAIIANAEHQWIEAVSTMTVIAGLFIGHYFGIKEADGYIGIAVSVWILYLGYTHGKHALIPLLGMAPDRIIIQKIRDLAKSIEGISDVHEIIVHDYGSLYLISLHCEIPEEFGSVKIHEITERCEEILRRHFGGEVVCHSDPLQKRTDEVIEIENKFKTAIAEDNRIKGYHDFRTISETESTILVVADIDAEYNVPESEFDDIAEKLEKRAMKIIPNLSYCSFYVTPKFAY
ncbi:cation diffusion facilitator family transporter [Thermodesulfobacteriota bacterium]